MNKKRIMINAVSAKIGGARTIVEKFYNNFDEDFDADFFCGFKNDNEIKNNISWYCISLSGIFSIIYTLFLSSITKKFFRCDILLSFNNINSVFDNNCITYFHQAKVFDDDNSLKCLIYRLYFKLKKTDNVIVQTNLIKKKFVEYFNYPDDKVMVVWPGVEPINMLSFGECLYGEGFYLVPYTDISSPHKNFNFIVSLARRLTNNEVILVTCEKPSQGDYPSNIVFIGRQTKVDLFNLYHNCALVLFPSKVETIGLPIFEGILSNKFICVSSSDYIIDHMNEFDISDRIVVSDNESLLVKKISKKDFLNDLYKEEVINNERDFLKSNWETLFGIIK
ncbi:TPA: hypothetical protein KD839_000178 [Vibrio parahaemolyticus]|uniref:Uncharacterized protein n=1 Tax=Vibrio parahaemolyticus TaxID=670 RepID=A0A7M1W2V5_VIBPH|nr:hypothetical protein [Vibrio sp. J2-4]MCF7478224.1 hypothetical protein [Vibrio sp. J2-4]QOS21262.1 hypothetical protein VP60_00033 [Vibrio parahaemolyticus]HBC3841602.1 hypothetical protein [Vibrio parahaemolyticus]HCM0709409.1 hypothetical protein [Vibrio parahaemolyticus]